jgi:hypothetical protein
MPKMPVFLCFGSCLKIGGCFKPQKLLNQRPPGTARKLLKNRTAADKIHAAAQAISHKTEDNKESQNNANNQ